MLEAEPFREKTPIQRESSGICSTAVLPREGNPDWGAVVARIHAGDPSAETELYQVFSRGIRLFILRQLGPEELEDNVHDCFLTCIEAIRKGEVREPERLMGFVRTIVTRRVANRISKRVEQRSRFCQLDSEFLSHNAKDRSTPEYLAVEKERQANAREAVAKLPKREREILTRFYVFEQPKEQICHEMDLTETQFRLLKSRTMTKFSARTQRLKPITNNRPISSYQVTV